MVVSDGNCTRDGSILRADLHIFPGSSRPPASVSSYIRAHWICVHEVYRLKYGKKLPSAISGERWSLTGRADTRKLPQLDESRPYSIWYAKNEIYV